MKNIEPPTKALLDDLLMHLERLFTAACQAVERCVTDVTTQINFNGSVDVNADFEKVYDIIKDLRDFNGEAKKKVDEIVKYNWDAWFSDPKTALKRAKSIRRETKKTIEYASKTSHPKIVKLIDRLTVERYIFELAQKAYLSKMAKEKP